MAMWKFHIMRFGVQSGEKAIIIGGIMRTSCIGCGMQRPGMVIQIKD